MIYCRGVVQRWNTRNPDPLIHLVDAWCLRPAPRALRSGASASSAINVDSMEEERDDEGEEEVAGGSEPLVPPNVRSYVLEQCVLRRLQSEVLVWDPLSDTVPIHCWIHPWLPLLSTTLR